MRQIIEGFIRIVESSNGKKELIEKDINEYYKINKDVISENNKILNTKLDIAIKNNESLNDFERLMEEIFKIITDEMGEDNFKRLMELQERYPYLKDMTKKIIPS